jgi:hypothetical protein
VTLLRNNAFFIYQPVKIIFATCICDTFVPPKKSHWNNRHINWHFIPAPSYTGDIQIGFLQGANAYWSAISITHLANGIHGIDYYQNGAWVNATMDGDMGEDFVILPTTTAGSTYQIRVHDASDQLINSGRIYNFSYPTSCGSSCPAPLLPITYTTS